MWLWLWLLLLSSVRYLLVYGCDFLFFLLSIPFYHSHSVFPSFILTSRSFLVTIIVNCAHSLPIYTRMPLTCNHSRNSCKAHEVFSRLLFLGQWGDNPLDDMMKKFEFAFQYLKFCHFNCTGSRERTSPRAHTHTHLHTYKDKKMSVNIKGNIDFDCHLLLWLRWICHWLMDFNSQPISISIFS